MCEKRGKAKVSNNSERKLHSGLMCGFRASDFMLTSAGNVVWCCMPLSRMTEIHHTGSPRPLLHSMPMVQSFGHSFRLNTQKQLALDKWNKVIVNRLSVWPLPCSPAQP